MKKIIYTLLIISFALSSFSQGLQPSTVGQVYNFSVGDTFEYTGQNFTIVYCPAQQLWFNGFVTSYTFVVVSSKYQSGDTLAYGTKQYVWSATGCANNQATTDSLIVSYSYPDIDSSVFWRFRNDTSGCNSNTTCYIDTVYLNSAVNNLKFNDIYENFFEGGWSYIFANGLGIYSQNNTFLLPPDETEFGTDHSNLIYYHKADGTTWGTPYYFEWITGVPNIPHPQLPAKIFPNPSSQNMVLEISEPVNQPLQLKFFDPLGQVVRQQIIITASTSIERENLANGIYFWQLENSEQVLSHGKLILQ